MKFWDSSALVPLLVEEPVTGPLCELYLREDGVLGQPSTLGFVCLDDRLSLAAQREGFQLVDRSNL